MFDRSSGKGKTQIGMAKLQAPRGFGEISTPAEGVVFRRKNFANPILLPLREPQERTNGDRKTQKKKRWIQGNGISSLGTSLHSSWIHIKNKDYGIQQYIDNSSGYRSHRIPHHPLGSPHPVVLLQGSSEHHPLASESLILDDAIPHTYHPLIPFSDMFKYAIMQYTPQRYIRRADFETQDTMRHLLDFKAGRRYATKWAAQIVGKTLSAMDLTNTVIVCIPASCEQTNKRRYKRFSADVCAMCNAINGFEHIQVIGKREKVHISKKHGQESNVQIDTDYFNGKRVLLIDDICTTCATANAFIEQMQKAGADVRMTLFLAKTKSYRRTSTIQYN